MRLILASASIRRAEVLRNAGLHFQVLSSAVDETPLPGEAANALVRRLAEAKAELVAARAIGPAIIVAADTPFKDMRDALFRGSKETTSTWWGCRWRGYIIFCAS